MRYIAQSEGVGRGFIAYFVLTVGCFVSSLQANSTKIETVVQEPLASPGNMKIERFFQISDDRQILLIGNSWQINLFDLAARKTIRTLPTHGSSFLGAALDPKGRYVFLHRNHGHGWIAGVAVDIATGEEVVDNDGGGILAASELSPSYTGQYRFDFGPPVVVRSLNGGAALPLDPLPETGPYRLSLSGADLVWDGDDILTIEHGNQVLDQFHIGGDPTRRPLDFCQSFYDSEDNLNVFGVVGNRILGVDLFSNKTIFEREGNHFELHPQTGRIAIWKKNENAIEIVRMASAELEKKVTGELPFVFSPAGSKLAVWNPHARSIEIHNLASGRTTNCSWPVESTDYNGPLSLDFHPDETLLAAAGSHICDVEPTIYDAGSGTRLRTMSGGMKPVRFLDNGNLLYANFDAHSAISLSCYDLQKGQSNQALDFMGITQNSYGVRNLNSPEPDGSHLIAESWGRLGSQLSAIKQQPDGSNLILWSIPGRFRGAIWKERNMAFVQRVGGGILVFNPDHPDDMEKRIHIIPFDSGETVAVNELGEYFAPPATLKNIGFRSGGRAFSFEQFDLPLNRPDKILKSLQASASTVEKVTRWRRFRLLKNGYSESLTLDDFDHFPQCEIISSLPATAKEREFSLTVSVSPGAASLSSIHTYINNVPVSSSKIEGGDHGQLTIPGLLSQGANKIEVSVRDANGLESTRSVRYCSYAPSKATKPELYVLAVGVSDYNDDSMDLDLAHKDAEDFTKAISEHGAGQYGEIHTRTIVNKEATPDSIWEAAKFLRNSRIDDQIILFFAGHGVQSTKDLEYRFCTANCDFKDVESTALSYSTIESFFKGVAARQRVILIDTCEAGGAYPEDDSSIDTFVKLKPNLFVRRPRGLRSSSGSTSENSLSNGYELFSDLDRNTGATVLTASSGVELTQALEEQAAGNGIFTFFLVNGLREKVADGNGDGDITVSELQTYLSTEIPKATDGLQRPSHRTINLESDFVIGTTTATAFTNVPQSSISPGGEWHFIESVPQENGGYQIEWACSLVFNPDVRKIYGIGRKARVNGNTPSIGERKALSFFSLELKSGRHAAGVLIESNGRGKFFPQALHGALAPDNRSFNFKMKDPGGSHSSFLGEKRAEALANNANSMPAGTWGVREIIPPEGGGWDISWIYEFDNSGRGIGRKVEVNGEPASLGEREAVSILQLSTDRGELHGTANERNHRGEVLSSYLQGMLFPDGTQFFLENSTGDAPSSFLVGERQ